MSIISCMDVENHSWVRGKQSRGTRLENKIWIVLLKIPHLGVGPYFVFFWATVGPTNVAELEEIYSPILHLDGPD